jgi:hypothetical protein
MREDYKKIMGQDEVYGRHVVTVAIGKLYGQCNNEKKGIFFGLFFLCININL